MTPEEWDAIGPCDRGLGGWYCTRMVGHDGPCALWPTFWRHPIWWLRLQGLIEK